MSSKKRKLEPAPPVTKAEFEELKAYWYDKLKDSGFVDAEVDEYTLKTFGSAARIADRHREPVLWQAKQEYYYLANQFLNEHKFKSKLDKIIWTYYSEAISVRDISDILRKAKVADMSKSAVWTVVEKLEACMKRKYLYRDPNKNEQ